MGITTVTAARILEGQRRGETGEENLLAFERFPYTALSKTYTTDSQTPESAGTMTAIVTGVKTRSACSSVDETVAARRLRGGGRARAADDPRAGGAARPRDRRRHDHDRHARDARRDLRAHARARLGGRRAAARRTRARRASRTSRASWSSSRTATASRSRSAAAARASCRASAADPEYPIAEGRAARRPRSRSRSGRRARRARPTSGTASSSTRSIRPPPTACSACSSPATCSSRPIARATPPASRRSRR